jgi:hypothetical protein
MADEPEKKVFDAEVVEPEKPAKGEEPLARTLYPYSKNPLRNRGRRIGIESFREVIQEENHLMVSLAEHEKLVGRLEDIPIEIATDHLRRVNELKEQEHQAEIGTRKHEVEILGLDVAKEELNRRLRILRGEKQAEDSLEAKLVKQNEEKALKRKYAIKQRIDEIVQAHSLKRETIESLKKLIQDIENSDLPQEEKAEQIQEIERLIIAIEQGI